MHDLELMALQRCALNDRSGVDDDDIARGFPHLAYMHLENDGLLKSRRLPRGDIRWYITDAGRTALHAVTGWCDLATFMANHHRPA